MTSAEQAAFEPILNTWLQHAIVIFAIGYWLYWGWRKLGIPGIDLRRYWTWAPREVATNNRSTYQESAPEEAPLQAPQPALRTPAKPIATLQTACKPDFAIASEVQKLAELLDADPDIIEQQLITLARLCDAEEIGETAAIKIGLGIAPSSASTKYKAAKSALAVLRKQPKTEIVGIEQDPTQPNRAVVVRG